jgi:hypothetical protein
MTTVALLGHAGIAGAGEIIQPVRLTAAQMDKITAGTAFQVGDPILYRNTLVIVTDHNFDQLVSADLLGLVAKPPPPCSCDPVPPLPPPPPPPRLVDLNVGKG